MKLPSQISLISVYDNHAADYPYPPAGWLPFWEHELGNGDMFGLYWPLGKEGDDPLVVEMWHDSWQMSPQYSSLRAFLLSSAALEDDMGRPEPTDPLDANSPVVLVNQAKEYISNDQVSDAIARLQIALNILPEYTLAKGLLVAQHQRNRDMAAATAVCLDALRSPLSFGRINEQLPIWFSRQIEAED